MRWLVFVVDSCVFVGHFRTVITTICLYFANTIRFGNAATATAGATAAVDDDDVLVNIGVRTKHFPIETRTENRHYIESRKKTTTYICEYDDTFFPPFVLKKPFVPRIPVVAK